MGNLKIFEIALLYEKIFEVGLLYDKYSQSRNGTNKTGYLTRKAIYLIEPY